MRSAISRENRPKSVVIHVTGFKKFHGVPENPTETIVNNLKDFVQRRGIASGVTLGSCTVLETVGNGGLPTLYRTFFNSGRPKPNEHVVWLHLGVHSAARLFAIERKAVNEATFTSPDELGWKPQRIPVVYEDGEISRVRETSCPIKDIQKLMMRKGFCACISNDAGTYVCNFVYYHSLRFAERRGHKSLFVHVPPFSKIRVETQMDFVATLLEAIAYTC